MRGFPASEKHRRAVEAVRAVGWLVYAHAWQTRFVFRLTGCCFYICFRSRINDKDCYTLINKPPVWNDSKYTFYHPRSCDLVIFVS